MHSLKQLRLFAKRNRVSVGDVVELSVIRFLRVNAFVIGFFIFFKTRIALK